MTKLCKDCSVSASCRVLKRRRRMIESKGDLKLKSRKWEGKFSELMLMDVGRGKVNVLACQTFGKDNKD